MSASSKLPAMRTMLAPKRLPPSINPVGSYRDSTFRTFPHEASGARPSRRHLSWREFMITLEKAHRVIAAGEAKAKEIGQPMNIAVVDAGTNLKAFTRMDGAWLASIQIP